MRLVLFRDPDLEEGVEMCPVPAAVSRFLDIGLDVGEPQDRGERRAGHAPVGPLPFPIGQSDRLQALDGLRRGGRIQTREGKRIESHRGPDPGGLRLLVAPRRREVLACPARQDDLVAVPGEARLHEQLDVAVGIRAGNMEAHGPALRAVTEEVLDEPESNVTGLGLADRIQLDDRPFVGPALPLDAKKAGKPTVVLEHVQQIVRAERTEGQTEQAKHPDRRAAYRESERAGGRPVVLTHPGQLAKRRKVGEPCNTNFSGSGAHGMLIGCRRRAGSGGGGGRRPRRDRRVRPPWSQ